MGKELNFTGERVIPEYNMGSFLYEEHLARYIFAVDFSKHKTVLDIACGSGYGSVLLSRNAKSVCGIDNSQEAIDYCKEKYIARNLRFLTGDVNNIPLEDKTIDLVVSFETLEHVDAPEQIMFLKEIKRVLSKDGRLIISTPNCLMHPGSNTFHKNELTPTEFKKILLKHFKCVEIFYQDLVGVSYISHDNKLISSNSRIYSNLDKNFAGRFLIAVCGDRLQKTSDFAFISNLIPKEVEYKYRQELINFKNSRIGKIINIFKQ